MVWMQIRWLMIAILATATLAALQGCGSDDAEHTTTSQEGGSAPSGEEDASDDPLRIDTAGVLEEVGAFGEENFIPPPEISAPDVEIPTPQFDMSAPTVDLPFVDKEEEETVARTPKPEDTEMAAATADTPPPPTRPAPPAPAHRRAALRPEPKPPPANPTPFPAKQAPQGAESGSCIRVWKLLGQGKDEAAIMRALKVSRAAVRACDQKVGRGRR